MGKKRRKERREEERKERGERKVMRGEAKQEGEREGRKRTKGKNVKQIQKESPNLQNTNYGRTQVDSQDPNRHYDQSQVEKKPQNSMRCKHIKMKPTASWMCTTMAGSC